MNEQTERELFALLQDIVKDLKEIKAKLPAKKTTTTRKKNVKPALVAADSVAPTQTDSVAPTQTDSVAPTQTDSVAPTQTVQPVIDPSLTLLADQSKQATAFAGHSIQIVTDHRRLFINGFELTDEEAQTIVFNTSNSPKPMTLEAITNLGIGIDLDKIIAVLALRKEI